jgi:hypothetical protein
MASQILEYQGNKNITGFLLDDEQPIITRILDGYELEISLDEGFGQSAKQAGGLIISMGADTFLAQDLVFGSSSRVCH